MAFSHFKGVIWACPGDPFDCLGNLNFDQLGKHGFKSQFKGVTWACPGDPFECLGSLIKARGA